MREGRAWFAVDVTAPLGTGLFVDMRMGRQIVAELAAGRRVLNCFSYTGAFSVVAGLHGAAEVVSVDSAARAHARARHNLTLNGLVTEQSTRFEFVTGDAMASLTRWASRKRQFDLVVLDPPTFATAKGRTFTALRDYAELTASAVSVLAPGGLLCAASNAAKLSQEDFERAIGRGAVQAQRTAAVVQRSGQPEDFPVLPAFGEGRYLKFVTVRVD